MLTIQSFFDKITATVTYLIIDADTKHCAIVDSVLDFDLVTGTIATHSADKLIQHINENQLTVDWILETHIHADHLTAAHYLKNKLGGQIGIGANIRQVLTHWVPLFDMLNEVPVDGSQFDYLFEDNSQFKIGNLTVKVLHTPGHTPDGVSYYVGDSVIVGDTLFMPYVGTGRTDFPGGSAAALYHSVQVLLSLPDSTKIYTGHDYPPKGKRAAWVSTVAIQKLNNILINEAVTLDEFIAERTAKDANKPAPRLLYPAIQANILAGKIATVRPDTQFKWRILGR